jgi:hypothetical protein
VTCDEGVCDPETGECVECLANEDCPPLNVCNAMNTCEVVECLVNNDCDDGDACTDDTCGDDFTCSSAPVQCPTGEECVDGECVPVDGGGGEEGDAVAGAAYYAANCAACHGANGEGGLGPNVQGQSKAELQAGVEAAPIHAAIPITEDDYCNLEAFLATLP